MKHFSTYLCGFGNVGHVLEDALRLELLQVDRFQMNHIPSPRPDSYTDTPTNDMGYPDTHRRTVRSQNGIDLEQGILAFLCFEEELKEKEDCDNVSSRSYGNLQSIKNALRR